MFSVSDEYDGSSLSQLKENGLNYQDNTCWTYNNGNYIRITETQELSKNNGYWIKLNQNQVKKLNLKMYFL